MKKFSKIIGYAVVYTMTSIVTFMIVFSIYMVILEIIKNSSNGQ